MILNIILHFLQKYWHQMYSKLKTAQSFDIWCCFVVKCSIVWEEPSASSITVNALHIGTLLPDSMAAHSRKQQICHSPLSKPQIFLHIPNCSFMNIITYQDMATEYVCVCVCEPRRKPITVSYCNQFCQDLSCMYHFLPIYEVLNF